MSATANSTHKNLSGKKNAKISPTPKKQTQTGPGPLLLHISAPPFPIIIFYIKKSVQKSGHMAANLFA